MAIIKLKAKLTGDGAVNKTYIYLENVPDKNNVSINVKEESIFLLAVKS